MGYVEQERERTDKELADALFGRISSKGFNVTFGNGYGTKDSGSWRIHGIDGVCCEIDFVGGKFYRISGFTHGHWQDEVDFKKY